MPGPYVKDGHYMYGTGFVQPYPPYYNASWLHKKPKIRSLPMLYYAWEDPAEYVADNPTSESNEIIRSQSANKIINIETQLIKSLKLTLYAMTEEEDTTLLLEIGKKYAITYITEVGLRVATGVLKVIDTTIPDTCQRYIGEINESTITAWIGLDCSTAGNASKKKIYIASIRAIEEVPEDESDWVAPTVDPDSMTDSEKLNNILSALSPMDSKLDAIIAKVADNDQIMGKLEEMDPTEKLELLSQLIEAKATDINDAIDTARTDIDTSILNNKNIVTDKIDSSTNTIVSDIIESEAAVREAMTDTAEGINQNIAMAKEAINANTNTGVDNVQASITAAKDIIRVELQEGLDNIYDSLEASSNVNNIIDAKNTILGAIERRGNTAEAAIAEAHDDLSTSIEAMKTSISTDLNSINDNVTTGRSELATAKEELYHKMDVAVEAVNDNTDSQVLKELRKLNEIEDHIDTKIDESTQAIIDRINDNKLQIEAVMDKLGDIDYGEKINYIFENIKDLNSNQDIVSTVQTTQDKLDYLVDTISDYSFVLMDNAGNLLPYRVGGDGYATFSEALEHVENNGTIKLTTAVDLTDSICEISGNKSVTLDLNASTITTAGTNTSGFVAKNGGTLTIKDSTDINKNGTGKGKIVSAGDDTAAIRALNGGTVIIDSGLIKTTAANGSAGGFGVTLEGASNITINGGRIESGWYAIYGENNLANANSSIIINGGEIESSTDFALYIAYAGNATINGGTINGVDGAVSIEAGNLQMHGGTITSNKNGIVISNTYGNPSISIDNGTINTTGPVIINNAGNNASIAISGGLFNSQIEQSYCADGYIPTTEPDENGFYTVEKA